MPGDDCLTNFRIGDPYVKVDEGYAVSQVQAMKHSIQNVRPSLSVLSNPKTPRASAWEEPPLFLQGSALSLGERCHNPVHSLRRSRLWY